MATAATLFLLYFFFCSNFNIVPKSFIEQELLKHLKMNQLLLQVGKLPQKLPIQKLPAKQLKNNCKPKGYFFDKHKRNNERKS